MGIKKYLVSNIFKNPTIIIYFLAGRIEASNDANPKAVAALDSGARLGRFHDRT